MFYLFRRSVFSQDKPPPTLSSLLWGVIVTDYLVKIITVIVKGLFVLLPQKVIQTSKRVSHWTQFILGDTLKFKRYQFAIELITYFAGKMVFIHRSQLSIVSKLFAHASLVTLSSTIVYWTSQSHRRFSFGCVYGVQRQSIVRCS